MWTSSTLARASRRSPLVITSTRNEIEQQYGLYNYYDAERMAVVPPGTDLHQFHPPAADEEFGFAPQVDRFLDSPGKPLILALSRPDERKNIAVLLEAFGQSKALRDAANLLVKAIWTDIQVREGVADFIVSLVPANPFAAASSGAILPLIVFTALVAAATGTLAAERRERLTNIAEDVSEALIKLVWWILYTAPIGVFGLTAPVTARLGWDLVQSLGVFIISVFAGLVIFLLLVTLPLVYLVGRISPGRFLGGTFGLWRELFTTKSAPRNAE